MRFDVGYKRERGLNLSGLPNIVFTMLICVACWGLGYYVIDGSPVRNAGSSTVLWGAICRLLPTGINHLYILGFILLCLGAILLQWFNFLFVIVKEKTTLPFLLFLLLNSVNPGFFAIRPITLALFLLLFAMIELYRSYQNQRAVSQMFNMMFFLSVSSLIWPYLLLFIPFFWIGMYQFRLLNPLTFSASLLGLFTTGWFVLGWCVWKHDYTVFINLIQCIADFRLIFLQESWLAQWLTPVCVFVCMILSFIHIALLKHENTIRSRNFLSFLLMIGIASFVISVCYASSFDDFVCMFYIPASLIIAYYLSGRYGFGAYLLYYLPVSFFILLCLVRLWNF